MTNREWEQFGEEIRRTVQNAVDSRNYEKLNQTITNTINQTLDTMAWNVKNFNAAMEQRRQNSYQYENNHQTQKRYQAQPIAKELLFHPRASAKAGSILLMIFGYSIGGSGLFLLLFLSLFGLRMVAYRVIGILMGLCGALTLGFGIMALIGTRGLMQSNRFKKYLRILNGRELCNLTELESGTGKSHKFIIRDLRKMIKKGWFRQGHLDKQNTCLMVTDRMHQQYLQLEVQKQMFEAEEKQREQRRYAERQATEKEQAERRQKLSPEVRKVVEEGDAFVQKLRECNDAILGEEISGKISRMEMVVDKIFDRVEQEPGLVDEIRKLMEYYLPTTIKLLEAYEEMDAQPVGGENIQTAKAEIEATLDTLNVAFEKLLDSLFQRAAWDISSDISVLNTMLAQEGLQDDGFF